jgi:hypothetical protein
MKCFCGCGRSVPRRLTDENLRLSEVSLELLAWDRHRTMGAATPVEAEETDLLVDRGAACHRRLLAALHGEGGDGSLEEGDEWLQESRDWWKEYPDMVEKESFWGPQLRVTADDLSRLDRLRPERSFSKPAPPAESGELVEQLERLGALLAQGQLTEEEFQAAKERVIGGKAR